MRPFRHPRGPLAVIGGDEDVLAPEEADELVRVATAIATPGDGAAVRSALATRLWGSDASDVASMLRSCDVWASESRRAERAPTSSWAILNFPRIHQ